MKYKIRNKMKQLLNVLVKDRQSGSSKTLTLMPRGRSGFEKVLEVDEMTDDILLKRERGYLAVQQES